MATLLQRQFSNRAYWEKREREAREKYLRTEAQELAEIDRIYREMYQWCEDEINRFYGKYADAEGIDITEAKKRVAKEDVQAFEEQARKYVADRDFSTRANDELRLYNATMKINRLELLKAKIGLKLIDGTNQIDKYCGDKMNDRAMEELTRQAGILGRTITHADTVKRANEIVNATFYNATYSQRIWSHMDRLRSEISIQLQRGLIAGIGSREMARRIKQYAIIPNQSDAERLMVTELRRVQTDVAMDSYKDMGITQYMYMAVNPNACPECRKVNGKIYEVKGAEVGNPDHPLPPMHPRCVVPDTKIIAPGIEAITKSWYSGAVIEFTLSDGRRLTVSPNHIMLTARGWVRAQDITKSDYVISYRRGVEPFLEGNPTDNDGVPSIEQVFTALIETQGVVTASVPATAEHLKGDVVINTEIEVVRTDCELWGKLDASKRELLGNIGFIGAGEAAERTLNAYGPIAKCLLTLGLAADRVMRGLSITPLFLWRSMSCRELIRLRTTADYNARLRKTAVNHGTADTEAERKSVGTLAGIVKAYDFVRVKVLALVESFPKLNAIVCKHTPDGFGLTMKDFGELVDTFSSEVQLDNIVNIRRFNYVGHVYDTSSMVTLYTANGVITSNCHCTTAPYSDPDDYEAWLNFLESGGTTAEWDKMTPAEKRKWA